jgi:putative phosphoesterase
LQSGALSYLATGGFVKIVIVSDIHGNIAALDALPERDYDALWCIGDLVDYGPRPHEVVQWIKRNAAACVRGNHDNAVGFSVDPRCSPPYKQLAAETLRYSRQVCSDDDVDYLRSLPLHREIRIDSTRFYLVHATPADPLFGYCPEDSAAWRDHVRAIEADVLIVGHTHTPFLRAEGHTTILNPGSLGQPKTGRPMACYAVWQDGQILRKEYEYPVGETIRGIREMPIAAQDQDALISVLQTGNLAD